MLNHDNILHCVRSFCQHVKINEKGEVIVSYLPLSHVAPQVSSSLSMMMFCFIAIEDINRRGRISRVVCDVLFREFQAIDLILGVYAATTIYFADKNALKGSLLKTLVVVQPTLFLGVPRVWEKFHEKIMEEERSNGVIKTWIVEWAKAQGLDYHMNRMNGVDHEHWGYKIAKWLVFDKVKAALGLNKCRVFYTAAAPISMDVKKDFLSLDIPLREMYGMSESSGPHTLTDYDHYT